MYAFEEGPLKRRWWALAALILLAVAVWALARPPADEAAVTAAPSPLKSGIGIAAHKGGAIDYVRLDSRLRRLVAEKSMVGLAVGVVENGEIRFLQGYGETVAGSNDRVTPQTIFRWASVSKGVAADMVAKLAGEGKVSLDAPVANYSASLRLPGGAEQRATVADLLSHTLGIFAHANDSKLEDGADPRLLRGELASLTLICSPGQCHSYQNVAYDTASEVVERVTGETYQNAVRTRLFGPLGMTSATLERGGLVNAASWARPHRGGKTSRPVEVTESYYRVPAAGGVNSSIKDLALWMRAQMGLSPSVLTPAALAEVQRPRINTPGELRRMRDARERLNSASYGLGWRIYDYAGHRIVGHRGGVTGYRSLVMFDPERKTGVVALWNSSTAQPGGLEFEVMDMLYGLPFRDWMKIDSGTPAAAPLAEPVVTDSGN